MSKYKFKNPQYTQNNYDKQNTALSDETHQLIIKLGMEELNNNELKGFGGCSNNTRSNTKNNIKPINNVNNTFSYPKANNTKNQVFILQNPNNSEEHKDIGVINHLWDQFKRKDYRRFMTYKLKKIIDKPMIYKYKIIDQIHEEIKLFNINKIHFLFFIFETNNNKILFFNFNECSKKKKFNKTNIILTTTLINLHCDLIENLTLHIKILTNKLDQLKSKKNKGKLPNIIVNKKLFSSYCVEFLCLIYQCNFVFRETQQQNTISDIITWSNIIDILKITYEACNDKEYELYFYSFAVRILEKIKKSFAQSKSNEVQHFPLEVLKTKFFDTLFENN